jgi:hypothetical protein
VEERRQMGNVEDAGFTHWESTGKNKRGCIVLELEGGRGLSLERAVNITGKLYLGQSGIDAAPSPFVPCDS